MRALIVTNMYPTEERPELGSFVRDQVAALQRLPGLSVELFAFSPGSVAAYGRAALLLRRRFGAGAEFDVVHAHFGLTGWPALAVPARRRVLTLHGTDLAHPRSRALTLAVLRRYDLVAAVSPALADVPGGRLRAPAAVLPAGVDVSRFRPVSRAEARRSLGLAADGPYLLFPADPSRPEKRFDLAREAAGEVPLLTLGGVAPSEVPLWINACNAVLVTSEREGFGLAVLESLACQVPVLSTPVGAAPNVLAGIPGVLCSPFSAATWRAALAPHLAAVDPRLGDLARERALAWSCDRMAERVLAAWEALG